MSELPGWPKHPSMPFPLHFSAVQVRHLNAHGSLLLLPHSLLCSLPVFAALSLIKHLDVGNLNLFCYVMLCYVVVR